MFLDENFSLLVAFALLSFSHRARHHGVMSNSFQNFSLPMPCVSYFRTGEVSTLEESVIRPLS